MRRLRKMLVIASMAMILGSGFAISSCGRTHAYWGVQNDYYMDGDGGPGHHDNGKHKGHYKKHKKNKDYWR